MLGFQTWPLHAGIRFAISSRSSSAWTGWRQGRRDGSPRWISTKPADAYVLTAEIPGVERDDIDIQTGDGRLTLSGVRQERPAACEQFHRLERGHGSFQRSFQLPLPIDQSAVTADLKDGVLTVRCPKARGAVNASNSHHSLRQSCGDSP